MSFSQLSSPSIKIHPVKYIPYIVPSNIEVICITQGSSLPPWFLNISPKSEKVPMFNVIQTQKNILEVESPLSYPSAKAPRLDKKIVQHVV